MHFPLRHVFFVLLIFLLVFTSGCTSPSTNGTTDTSAPAVTIQEKTRAEETAAGMPVVQKESIADQLASVRSTNPVFSEAYRMYRNIKSTGYVHPPYTVDDTAGIYKFDCLGFVDHVLMNADMTSYKEIGKNANPSIESYSAYFNKLDTKTPDALGWTKVSRPIDQKPGDVCLWLEPTTLDTGHMWIIAGTPAVNPERAGEVMVRIFDSSVAHSDDSRKGSSFKTGLGSGILGYMVDGEGNPAGLYWDGGVSTSAGEKGTTIVCGRLNR